MASMPGRADRSKYTQRESEPEDMNGHEKSGGGDEEEEEDDDDDDIQEVQITGDEEEEDSELEWESATLVDPGDADHLTLAAITRKLEEQGAGPVMQKQAITRCDLRTLYTCSVLDSDTPFGLLNKVWFASRWC